MSRKDNIKAPLKLQRPADYVIQFPEDYNPPKYRPEKPKIQKPKREKIQKLVIPKIPRIPRISRPTVKKIIDEKKKYYLPGQKYPTPDEDDGLRIFYQSLLTQKPQSQMALKFCIEHGLLQKDIAENIIQHEKMQKIKRSNAHF